VTAVDTEVAWTRRRDLLCAEGVVLSLTGGERSELVVLSAELVTLVVELAGHLEIHAAVDVDDPTPDLDPLRLTDLATTLLRDVLLAGERQR